MPVLIHSEILNGVESLGRQFRSNQPFPHLVLDDFVDPDYLRQLQDEFPAFDSAHALNEMGEVGRKAFRQDLPRLGPAYRRFDAMLRSPEFLGFVAGSPALGNCATTPSMSAVAHTKTWKAKTSLRTWISTSTPGRDCIGGST